jgi:hypothetical protein
VATILQQLVDELTAGRVRVVDLTQPLGPSTPVIGLPPMFAPSPGVTIETISRYVLEHAELRRAHGHALRRADPLGHRQGSAGQRLRHHSGPPVRRPGLRD